MTKPYKRKEQIGDATLYLGDCLEVMQSFPDCFRVHAGITDPPYGIGFDYLSYDDTPENLQNLIDSFVPMCRRISKRVVITPGNTNICRYPQADWYGAWTFDTTSSRGRLGWSNWQPFIFYGEDVSKGTKNWNGALKSDRIHISVRPDQIAGDKKYDHSCPKPVAFVNKLIHRFSSNNDSILDPFMGSGTTGVACANLGRKFIGIEIEEKYFDIACERIAAAYAQGRLFA